MDHLRHACLLLLLRIGPVLSGQDDPLFHWPLDAASGTQVQDIASGQHGMLQSGAVWMPGAGQHGGAVHFDGVGGRITLPPCDITTGNPGFTLALWCRPGTVHAGERVLIAKTSGPDAADHIWSLSLVNATALRFRLKAGGTTTTLDTPGSSVFSGTWYHVAATYDGSMMRLYLNGSLISFTARSGLIGFHPQAPASMGARAGGEAPYGGYLDDVRIYDRALSAMDVVLLMFEVVTTGIGNKAAPPFHVAEGVLHLKAGPWSGFRIADASGRIILQRRLARGQQQGALPGKAGEVRLLLLEGPAGIKSYPVMLQ